MSFNGEDIKTIYKLKFEDGRFSTQFCNLINGAYTDKNGTLSAVAMQTQMACEEEQVTQLESAFNLEGASYEITKANTPDVNLKITTKAGDIFNYEVITAIAPMQPVEMPGAAQKFDENAVSTNLLSNTTWELEAFNDKTVSGNFTMEISNTNMLHTKFCNTINGSVSITETTINGTLMSTRMACDNTEANELENAFNLNEITYTIASTRMATNNIEKLTITTKEGNTFRRNKVLKNSDSIENLDGTSWKLSSFNGENVKEGYTLNFIDGRLSAKLCNNMNGAFTLSGETINGNLISTLMACVDTEAATLESKFSIDNATLHIKDNMLALTTKAGDIFTWTKNTL